MYMIISNKQVRHICMTFILLTICLLVSKQTVLAGTNESQQTSQTIEVNEKKEGVMESDYSWYVTKLTESGYFYVDFNRASEDGDRYTNAGWKLSVYVDNKFILDSRYISESNSSYTTPIYAYPAGTTVYIRIQNSGAGTKVPYTFEVVNKASDSMESENNDTKSKADTISVNKFYKGNFGSGDVIDYYKTKLKKTGYMYIDFGRVNLDGDRYTNAGWKISLIVGNKCILDSVYVSEDAAINGYRSPLFGYQKGQTVYVRIDNSGANNNVDYKFCLKNATSSAWESENNNTRKTADSIKVNTTYFGNFCNDDNVDYFTGKAKKTGKFRLSFGRRLETGDRYFNAGWKVTVFVDKKRVLDSEYISEDGALNGYLSDRFTVKKGQKITVMIEDSGAHNNVDYKFRIKM